jgi:hypothetical protein
MIKLIDLLKEDNPFVPKVSKEERKKEYNRALQTQVQQYVKDGMKGDLNLSNTPITSLPDNLTKVEGNLNLSKTLITSLPSNLTKVGGELYLENTPITSLPDNLTVGYGLHLSNTPIASLPSNLTVEGDLDLSNTKITSLPNNLRIGGDDLYLRNTPLSEKFPKNKIGAFFYEKKIRAMVKDLEGKNFKGYINM